MPRSEFLFAQWAVRPLQDARGARWKKLVEDIAALPETDPDALAFQLLMVKINSCATCDARKYAERGGCARCAKANLAFSRDTESTLLARYRQAQKEIAEAFPTTEGKFVRAA